LGDIGLENGFLCHGSKQCGLSESDES